MPAKEPPSAVRRALVRFAVGSLVALIAIAVSTLFVAKNLAERAALREAKTRGAALARVVAGPLVDVEVRQGDKVKLAALNEALRSRLLEGSIVHMKVWDADGQVLWSDEHTLRGRRFSLEPSVHNLFGTNNVVADVSRMDSPENELEQDSGPLLEVYAGTTDADGAPIVFESYWSDERVNADRTAILGRLAPISLGSLILFELAVFPLAISLGRGDDRGQSERNKMLRHAISAADLERRRIAQDLHDGVVQDLAGIAFALPSVQAQLPPGPGADGARRVIDELEHVVRRDLAGLRSMLTETYPPGLDEHGLRPAVEALAKTAARHGVVVEVAVDGVADTRPDDVRLVYRVIREGLRNVAKHARATSAMAEAHREGDVIIVTVADDGRGVDDRPAASGHLGLRVLADLLHDVDGSLELRARPGGGTILEATFVAGIAVL